MRDDRIIIYDDKPRLSEEKDLLGYAVLPFMGAAVMWTYWLQQEVLRVLSDPFDHLGYTALVVALALLVFGTLITFIILITLAALSFLMRALRFAMRWLRRLFSLLARIFAISKQFIGKL